MEERSVNVFPDTVAKIEHARSLACRPREDRMVADPSIGALLARRVAEGPRRAWLTYYGEEGRERGYTRLEFDEAVRRVAGFMADRLRVAAGDRVATVMVNDPRTVVIYFAAWLLGATVVPVNCGEDDERLAFILADSGACAAFVMADQVARVEPFRADLPQVRAFVEVGGGATPGYASFEDAACYASPLRATPDVPPDAEALIVYTSGTTGAPKGVVLDHYDLLVDAHSIGEWHRFGPADRAMCVLPIHHVNGTVVTLVTPLYTGGSVVLNRRFRAQAFWRTLADEGCTWTSVVPTVLAFLCERHETLDAYDLTRFRHIICGAGPLTVELARRFDEAFGVRVVHGYGLSETTCYSCFLPIDLEPEAYHHWMTECGFPSIGIPITANEMAIHDMSGRPVPADERGEIVVRGHNVMRYYFKRPDANRGTFAHGWFRSGDEGFWRAGPDGRSHFFITGRLKELIIRGGTNYSPFEIDEVLCEVPGVKAAMAVGFDNDYYGEEIGAYVQLEPGVRLSEDEVLAACRRRLPFSKSPKVVVFGDSFPVTSTGKYQRHRLKPLFAAWKRAQFRDA